MRIAILGTRGIPANYGGFETFAEELSTRLVERGHEVTVYCRERHPEPRYRGVRLQYLPTIRHKYFDTLAHTFFSTLHLLAPSRGRRALLQRRQRHLHAAAAPVRHAGGAERGRPRAQAQEVEPRWRKAWYLVSEWLATFCPTVVITDAQTIQQYYRERYGKASDLHSVRRGDRARWRAPDVLDKLGLEPGRYFLYVSRMEPENHPLEVREAFEQVDTPHEAGADRRRAVRARIHPPRARHQRSAHRDARRDLRRRATASSARTASPTSTRPRSAARIRR